MTTKVELILYRLEETIQDALHKHTILERLLISNMNLEESIKILQPLELIKDFNQQKYYQDTYNITKFVIKCKLCGKKH